MALSLPARSRWILAVILLAGIVVAWSLLRKKPPDYPVAYVGDRMAVVWSTTAQVRQTIATLHYGDRVSVMRRTGDQAQVRLDGGTQGWVEARALMQPELWQRGVALLALARSMPPQAVGRTRTFSNLRIEPGREAPRIFQFARNVPVVVLDRKTAPAPQVPETANENAGTPETTEAAGAAGAAREEAKPQATPEAKREDWLLVMRLPPDTTPSARSATAEPSAPDNSAGTSASSLALGEGPAPGAFSGTNSNAASPGSPQDSLTSVPAAGWVLARFIELQPPAPIPDYSGSAGMHVVAWAMLNTITDAGGNKPQYLVAGSRGPEGQPCDFTLLRVYTWDVRRQRYETAYVEGDLCGRLPLTVQNTPAGPNFTFADAGQPGNERLYTMRQTVVRRVNTARPNGRGEVRTKRVASAHGKARVARPKRHGK